MGDNSIKIVCSDFKEVKDEVIGILVRNRAKIHSPEYIEWKFSQRAKIQGDAKIALCLFDNKVIGSLTGYPIRVSGLKGNKNIYQLGDLSVDTQFRKQGIATKLFKCMMESIGPQNLFMGIPTPGAAGVGIKAGHKLLATLDCYTIGIKYPLYIVSKTLKLIHSIYPGNWNISKRDSYNHKTSELHFSECKTIPSDFNDFWKRISEKDNKVIICRDREVFEWRYIKNPEKSYNIFTVTENSIIRGYVVLYIKNENICQIVDSLYENQIIFKTLINSIMGIVKKKNLERIEFFIKGYEEIKFLKTKGFIKRKGSANVYGFCDDKNINHDKYMNSREWHLMLGDKEI